MSEDASVKYGRKRGAARFWFLGAGMLLSLALVAAAAGMYRQVAESKRELTIAKRQLAEVEEEQAEWMVLESNYKELRQLTTKTRKQVDSAFRSFQREELHEPMRRALEAANSGQVVVVEQNSGSWEVGVWVWVPEEGHRLHVELEALNFESSDFADAKEELQTHFELPLTARRAHFFEFKLHENWKEKNAEFYMRLNGETLAERVIALDPASMGGRGGTSENFYPPRQTPMEWSWDPEALPRRVDQGVWLPIARNQFGFRRPEKPVEPKSASDEIELQLELGLATDKPFYAPSTMKSTLQRSGISFQPAATDSDFEGLLEILGREERQQ